MSTDNKRYPSVQVKYHPELLHRALNVCTTYAPRERYTRSVVFQALIMYAKESHDYGAQGDQPTRSAEPRKVFPWVTVYLMAGDVESALEATMISVTEAWNASIAASLSLDCNHRFKIPSQARDAVLIALWTSVESHKRPFDEAAYLECLASAKRMHASARTMARRQRSDDAIRADIDAITAPKTPAMSEAVTSCIDAVFAHFCPQLALDEELADTFTTEFKAKRVLKTLSDAQR